MRIRRRIPAAAIALGMIVALAAPVAGQGGADARSTPGDFEYAARDILHVWSAPFHSNRGDWRTALLVGAATGATMSVDAPVQAWVQERRRGLPLNALRLFGEDSPLNLYGRTHLLAPASVLLYLSGVVFDEAGLRDAGIGCLTANITNALSRRAVAVVVGRARPQEERGPFDFRVPNIGGSWEIRSFPSGHGANAMACTSFWTRNFDLGIAEPLLWTLAGAVGFARMADDAHWLSDTLFGMSWGIAVGKAVAVRYDDREENVVAHVQAQPLLVFRLTF